MSRHFLERLNTVYGKPTTDDPQSFLAEYSSALKDYPHETMNRAIDLMLRERKFRTWPTIGELKRYANQALAEARTTHEAPAGPTKKDESWSKESVAEAYELIKSPMGVRAGEEGWILALWHFCRRARRLPRNTEIGDLKGEANRFNHHYAAVCAGGLPLSAPLRRLGESMLERRQKLANVAAESQGLTAVSQRMTGGN